MRARKSCIPQPPERRKRRKKKRIDECHENKSTLSGCRFHWLYGILFVSSFNDAGRDNLLKKNNTREIFEKKISSQTHKQKIWTSWVGWVRVVRQGNKIFVGNQSQRSGETNFHVRGPHFTPMMNTIIGFDYARTLSSPVTIAHEVWEWTSPSRTYIYTHTHTTHYIIELTKRTTNSITNYFFFCCVLFGLNFLSRFNVFSSLWMLSLSKDTTR